MALVHLCVSQPENITRTNWQPVQCFGFGHVLPSLDHVLVSPVLVQHSDAWVCWCLRRNVKETSRSSFLHPLPVLLLSSYSLSNVPVYRWDVDDVDKRILHFLGFFLSWFVTVTVTVWKNKIRIRHASLGELGQKKKNSVSWITINTDMLAVFTETQIKSNHLTGSATRRDKLLLGQWCWGKILSIFLIRWIQKMKQICCSMSNIAWYFSQKNQRLNLCGTQNIMELEVKIPSSVYRWKYTFKS